MNKSANSLSAANSELRQKEGHNFYPKPPGTADAGSRNRGLLGQNRSLNNIIKSRQ